MYIFHNFTILLYDIIGFIKRERDRERERERETIDPEEHVNLPVYQVR